MPELRASLAVLALATALPLASAPIAAADASPAMVIAELPGLPGFADNYVTGLNDLGQVVGSAQRDGVARAVLWSPRGGATDIGAGLAKAVNEHGQVLGLEVRSSSRPYSNKAWVWSGGTRTAVAPSSAAWSLAPAINESGVVPLNYSTSSTAQNHNHAAVLDNGTYAELSLSGPDLWVHGVNDAGVVIGSYASAQYQDFAAVRCVAATCTRLATVKEGYGPFIPESITESGVVVGNRATIALRWEGDEVTVLSGNGRVAHGEEALNERGDAVGWSADATGSPRAVLWPAGGKTVDLGVPAPSEAVAINERGDVVGYTTANGSTPRAFLWRDGELTYLDTLGGGYSAPVAINNHGVIVGHSSTADGVEKPVRWTPAVTSFGGR
ncbi:MAG: hypothetical protein HOV94_00015 [Saccharothrix sp.]|nr:hypothetical protein [Saccharothrix sp.]